MDIDCNMWHISKQRCCCCDLKPKALDHPSLISLGANDPVGISGWLMSGPLSTLNATCVEEG